MGVTSIIIIVNILFVIRKRRNGVNSLFSPKKSCILTAGKIPFFKSSHGDGSPRLSNPFPYFPWESFFFLFSLFGHLGQGRANTGGVIRMDLLKVPQLPIDDELRHPPHRLGDVGELGEGVGEIHPIESF
jgi:hypothetical protein